MSKGFRVRQDQQSLSLDCHVAVRALETMRLKEEPSQVRVRSKGRMGLAAAQHWGGEVTTGSLRAQIFNLRSPVGSGWGCREGFQGQGTQSKKARPQLQSVAAGRSESPGHIRDCWSRMCDFLSLGHSHHYLPPLSGLLMGGWAGGGCGAHRLAMK